MRLWLSKTQDLSLSVPYRVGSYTVQDWQETTAGHEMK